tara:strand:+ start:273 stop:2108 length:1836 start_codon:yes stop_codon:yes gene_type:complete
MNRDGALSLGDIGNAFGDSTPNSLSEFYHDNPYYTDAPSSGAISIGDIRQTSAGVQYGQIDVALQHNVPITVNFSGTFNGVPCVFFTQVLNTAGRVDFPYLESVTTSAFTIRSMGGKTDNLVSPTHIHWLAVVPNYPNTNTYGGLEYSCQRKFISGAHTFDFDYGNKTFSSVPVILCDIQNDNDGTGTDGWHVRRWSASLTTSGFSANVHTIREQYPALSSTGTDIGILAIEQGTGSDPFIKTAYSPDNVTHEGSYTLDLGQTFPEVTAIATSTFDGGDPSASAITGQTTSSVTLTVQEASDEDGAHTTEVVAVVAFGKTCPIQQPAAIPTGGTITDVIIGRYTYRVHAFTSVGNTNFIMNEQRDLDILIVAGGGGGGGSAGGGASGGGGGAGGLILLTSQTKTSGTYTITTGGGGTGVGARRDVPGGDGNDSSAFGTTADGGGAGGCRAATNDANANGRNGGSGGGEGSQGVNSSYGSGTSGQGNRGGLDGFSGNGSLSNASGGGGGAGGVGGDGLDHDFSGNGGVGLDMSSYFTTAFGVNNGYFAGGGGGGTPGTAYVQGSGGLGGGGDGGSSAGVAGTANTGGGGGGAPSSLTSGAGGSGIVLIRYKI